jgi:hypothetical protein
MQSCWALAAIAACVLDVKHCFRCIVAGSTLHPCALLPAVVLMRSSWEHAACVLDVWHHLRCLLEALTMHPQCPTVSCGAETKLLGTCSMCLGCEALLQMHCGRLHVATMCTLISCGVEEKLLGTCSMCLGCVASPQMSFGSIDNAPSVPYCQLWC